MPKEYHVVSYSGDTTTISEIMYRVTEGVNAFLLRGATLVGGINVTQFDDGTVVISQALLLETKEKAQ
jgi:hypothetical protein